jgi:hypothetical protein
MRRFAYSSDMKAAPPTPSSIRGKFVVIGIFGVAILLAAFAWWWNLRQNPRATALWGRDSIRLIRLAKHVELWDLAAADTASESAAAIERLIVDGTPYQILQRRNISQARGLIHARHALTEDASYDWGKQQQPPSDTDKVSWRFAIRFEENARTATLLVDPETRRIRLLETKREGIVIPRIIAGWEKFAERESAPPHPP